MPPFFKDGFWNGIKLMFAAASVFILPKKYQNRMLSADEAARFKETMGKWQDELVQPQGIERAKAIKAVEALFQASGLAKPEHIIVLGENDQIKRVSDLVKGDPDRHYDLEKSVNPLSSSTAPPFLIRKLGPEFPTVNGLEGLFDNHTEAASVRSQVKSFTNDWLNKKYGGGTWSYFSDLEGRSMSETAGLFDCITDLGLKMPAKLHRQFQAVKDVIEHCGTLYYIDKTTVFVTGHPQKIERDQNQRLHNETGPALVLANGLPLYALRGIEVPETVIFEPERIDFTYIANEANMEVRRVLIAHIGAQRFLEGANAKKINSDESGILWRVVLTPDIHHEEGDESWVEFGEIWQAVEVKNSTVEPDGQAKTYFLCVPPDVNTARAAVAWTFGMTANEYNPTIES